jgi:type I restriction enzyme S subunit
MKKIKIGTIAKIFNGYAFKSAEYSDNGFQVIRITNVQNGYISNGNKKYIKFDNKSLEKFILNDGDILISLTGNVGRVGRIGRENLPAVLNQRVGKVVIQSKDVLPDYLFHILKSGVVESELIKKAKGIAQKNIGSLDIENIEISLPPVADQKRIVKILDKADTLRQKRKQAVEFLDKYLKSVFLEMFGDSTNNTMKWDIKKIEDITSSQKYSIRMGPFGSQLKKQELVNEGIKVIWIEDIVKNKFNWIEKNGKCITTDKFNQLKGFETTEDDILITNMGTIGRTAIVPKNFGKAIISSHLLKITPNTKIVNSIFLSEYIKSDFARNYFDKVAHGQIMKGLNTTKIKNLPIILPDIKLQNKFSDIFKKINEIKQTMIDQSKKLEIQFQSLMQKAFKGEL